MIPMRKEDCAAPQLPNTDIHVALLKTLCKPFIKRS